jgi:hypothetical protein
VFSSVTLMSIVFMIIGAILIIGGALALWRFASLHAKGTPMIARPIPAADGAHWRHGVMVYTESCLKLYKLRSLRPGRDAEFARNDVKIIDRRDPTDIEAGFFQPGLRVVRIESAKNGQWELALDSSADTALVAWVESKPSSRQTRELPTNIERRFRHVADRGRRAQK